MGKKSKAKASKSAEKPGALAPAGTPVSNNGTGSKKERCVTCLALLKDLAKAHACPGCSLLYCWRCAKKAFGECPNERLCVAHPARRCTSCLGGFTREAFMDAACVDEEGNPFPKERHSDLFQKLCTNGGTNAGNYPNLDSMPLQQCGADGCSVQECYRCLTAPNSGRMISCSLCSLIRCWECVKMRGWDSTARKYLASVAASGVPFTDSNVAAASAVLREGEPEMIGKCKDCGNGYCLSCMDDMSIQNLSRCILNGLRNANECGQFQCSRCYWASKPCTNPNCPNEAGIPTKRCGGCHLDRYCSIECQAAMYPDHVGRCKKISAKRTAAGEK